MVGMGVAGEPRLYAAMGAELPVRVPKVFCSGLQHQDDTSFVVVLEDLTASGCRFPKPDDPDVLDGVAVSLVDGAGQAPRRLLGPRSSLAGRHRYRERGEASEPRPGWRAGRRSSNRRSIREPGRDMPAEFQQLGDLYVDRYRDIGSLFNEGETTLIHGDSHIGNLFVDQGRTGFYDWAVSSRSPGMRDMALLPLQLDPDRGAAGRGDLAPGEVSGRPGSRGIRLGRRGPTRAVPVVLCLLVGLGRHDGVHGIPMAAGGRGTRAMDRTTQAIADLEVLAFLRGGWRRLTGRLQGPSRPAGRRHGKRLPSHASISTVWDACPPRDRFRRHDERRNRSTVSRGVPLGSGHRGAPDRGEQRQFRSVVPGEPRSHVLRRTLG